MVTSLHMGKVLPLSNPKCESMGWRMYGVPTGVTCRKDKLKREIGKYVCFELRKFPLCQDMGDARWREPSRA
jgi:hypothetical protein